MKTTRYIVATTFVALGFATIGASAGTQRVIKGRAGYAYVHVSEQKKAQANQKADRRAKTVGLMVGKDQRGGKMRSKSGGRGRVGLQRVAGR